MFILKLKVEFSVQINKHHKMIILIQFFGHKKVVSWNINFNLLMENIPWHFRKTKNNNMKLFITKAPFGLDVKV
jgi:hypothetical protein